MLSDEIIVALSKERNPFLVRFDCANKNRDVNKSNEKQKKCFFIKLD